MKNSILFVFLALAISCQKKPINTTLKGTVFGTNYTIIYNASTNYQKPIDSIFNTLNNSLSNYQYHSNISKINRNETDVVDTHFSKVFTTSKQIYSTTNGVFDPTIGTIVNALGFGSGNKLKIVDSLKIDSLMQFVGFNKVTLNNNKIIKPKATFLDFNAIAKGYAVDVVSEFLEAKNHANYLVEIGGEIRTKGINKAKNDVWKVGIDNPNFDGFQSFSKIISLSNKAMATSGTYRKFKIDKNGNRYAHIINPKTGYPSKSNILSVSVCAKNCMLADAYATAFQVMGIEQVQDFLRTHPELQVYIIYENEEQKIETLGLNGFFN